MRLTHRHPAAMFACGCLIAISGGFALQAQQLDQQAEPPVDAALEIVPGDQSQVTDQSALPSPGGPMSPMTPDGAGKDGKDGKDKKDDFPPFETVIKGMEKVVSTADGSEPFYTLYANKKDGSLVAELPRDFENKLLLIAPTVAGGDEEAGVMGGTIYGYWKRIDKSLVLMEPNFAVKSTGDKESQTSIKQLFTDRVLVDVPISTMGPGGGPVIDLKNLFVAQAGKWFTPAFGGYGPSVAGVNPRLLILEKAKAFPQNIEITYQMPDARGRLVSLHYSVRNLPENPGYKPRLADSRVGYFNIYYNDLGKPGSDEPFTRYITRWQLEKADPSLKLSPPKQPIVWYIEHTTPVRYRRWVRDGILSWNTAFEACGFFNAVEVYQQDASTGEHMDKDPEDCRYNFFRWNTSNQGYAIGPSREDPRTGQTVDADVVWHSGLTNAIMSMYKNLTAQIATANFTPETLAWLADRPQWDPRVRLAPPSERDRIAREIKAQAMAVREAGADDAPALEDCRMGHRFHGPDERCRIGDHLSMNIGLFGAALAGGLIAPPEGDAATLDSLPEEFLGPMIRYVSAHEVGHCLGLQHNFSASTIRSLNELNSKGFSGPSFGSVMEYAGVNINFEDGEIQGPYTTGTLGPYDIWAIQFGYGPEEDREKILARVSEPELVFHNDIHTIGPDPRVMTWDMGADSLDFCDSRMRIVRDLRGKITSDLVKKGEPWRRARDRYVSLLNTHMQTIAIASRWVGGSYVNRDFKGDPGERTFIENVPAERQRRALAFIVNNALRDDAFGLTPQLVQNLGVQFWPDDADGPAWMNDPAFELHDVVSGIQAAALTMVINPTTLRRLYDNEFRTNGSTPDPITLAEVMNTITDAVWGDLKAPSEKHSPAKPLVSSFRRNLQREHVERLIDLAFTGDAASPAERTISNLSILKLRQINDKIKASLVNQGNVDEYTVAHLADAQQRINKALEAQYVLQR